MHSPNTVSSSDILSKKVLNELNNGNDITEFLIEYIKEKSYGSFRTFSKRLKEIVIKLLDEGFISQEEYKKIHDEIKLKQTKREPELIFSLDTFLEEYANYFAVHKDEKNNLINTVFLMLPFLYSRTFKDVLSVKFKEVDIHNFGHCIIIKDTNEETGKITSVKMSQYFEEWEYIYNNLKDLSSAEYIFEGASPLHTVFSQQIEPFLKIYVKKQTTQTKYITHLKNSLTYSKSKFLSNF